MIGGSDYFGKCDQVPGECYVATRFLHVCWFPFVPRESWIILERESNRWRKLGIPVARSWRSIRWAWFRAICYLMLITGLLTLSSVVDSEFGWNVMKVQRVSESPVVGVLLMPVMLALISSVALIWSYQSSRADENSARALRQLIGEQTPNEYPPLMAEERKPRHDSHTHNCKR